VAGRRRWAALPVAIVCAVLGGCEETCPKVAVCDIRERDCQRGTMKAVACLRGGSADDLPPVSVISEQELIERVRAYGDDDPEARDESEARYALWTRALSLFALAPDGYDVDDAVADSAAETAAAYFPHEGDIVIVDRGESLADGGVIEVFAHEIVHALQDRELDLLEYGQTDDVTFDSNLALDALIEGEAVHYQILAAVQLANRSPDDLDWEGLYRSFRSDVLIDADADEAPVALAGMRFPYAFGGGFVSQHWLARGRSGIDALFEHPPRTTSEVMFGRSARLLGDARDTLASRSVPELEAAFEEQTSTALGAWIARMYAARAGLRVNDLIEPAEQLGADSFSVHYDPGADTVLAAWRARMLDGASPETWPEPARDTIVEEVDHQRGEATQLASEGRTPVGGLAMLTWRAPTEPEEDDEEEAEAAAGPIAAPFSAAVVACPGGRVRLRWR
jgi:hypothetical protein